jgi:hypothetical protein
MNTPASGAQPQNPMASQAAGAETQNSTATLAAQQMKTTLKAADDTVNQGVQTLGFVQQARLARASRTLATLTAQYGASDPRVVAAQALVTATTTTIGRVSMARQQLAVPAVQVGAKGWALQGYVYDAQYTAMAKYTVFLVDDKQAFVPQYGFAYTDATGYFLINYAPDSGQAPPSAVFVAIVDTNANPVYLSTTAFQPVIGVGTLGDPTQAIRNVAFPSTPASAQTARPPG